MSELRSDCEVLVANPSQLRGADQRVVETERLYQSGHASRVVEISAESDQWGLTSAARARVLVARAMAQFDVGDVVDALRILTEVSSSAGIDPKIGFDAVFALLLRASDFGAPAELLPIVSRLRQAAAKLGNATSLASLHLAVARLEGLRGRCVDAHRHIEIARRLSSAGLTDSLQCVLDLVEGSLESIAGNFARSKSLSEACLRQAERNDFAKHRLGALTNLAMISLYTGDSPRARRCLLEVVPLSGEMTWVRLGASDAVAQVELYDANLAACALVLENCAAIAAGDRVPARSWYDLAHQLTRCAYLERIGAWDQIMAIADEVDPELARRQYKALRTSLLCAKARALGRLGRHADAQVCLGTAVRTCPRGAVNP